MQFEHDHFLLTCDEMKLFIYIQYVHATDEQSKIPWNALNEQKPWELESFLLTFIAATEVHFNSNNLGCLCNYYAFQIPTDLFTLSFCDFCFAFYKNQVVDLVG